MKHKLATLIAAALAIVCLLLTFDTRISTQRPINPEHSVTPTATTTYKIEGSRESSDGLDKAQQLIHALRASATNRSDIQALSLENAVPLEQLRLLGGNVLSAYLAEIADKTSPASLRILLIELVAHLDERHDPRFGLALMAIITDTTDDKDVRMRALLWIPETGHQGDGATLLAMLPQQTDSDLEFAITRSLRGFKVPGSVDVLAAELSDAKSHLIRIAAYHALASQADETALTVLQKSVASRLADGSQESQAQENAVAVHGLLALGELPNSSSLALLESVAKNPANSVSVRSTAFTSIAAIGGVEAQQPLRRALKDESDESLLVYIARALAVVGEASDAPACLEKAATVSDSYTKSELQRAARALQTKR